MTQYHQPELNRLTFVARRGGRQSALDFARQGIKQYRGALAQRNRGGHRTGYGLSFRKALVQSLLVYRAFLRGNLALNHEGAGPHSRSAWSRQEHLRKDTLPVVPSLRSRHVLCECRRRV